MLNGQPELVTSARRSRWSFLVAVALVVTVALAACADDGDSSTTTSTATEDSAPDTTSTTTENSAPDTTATTSTATEQEDTTPDDGGRRNPGGAYGEYGVYERVMFPAGASSATITDAVAQGTVNGYLLGAAAGQFMTVQVTSENRDFFVSFEVYGPDDTPLPDDSVLEDFEALTYTAFFTLPADGDYLVVVQALRGGSPYVLDVEITDTADTPDDGAQRNPGGAYGEYGVYERVTFPVGASSATITDAVAQGTVNGYLLGAAAGQFMTVQVTSENRDFFVSFEVYDPDDTALPDDSVLEDFDALTYTAFFTLPADGDYLVVVQALRGGSPYVLYVEITDTP